MSKGRPRLAIQPTRRDFFTRSLAPLLLNTLRLRLSGGRRATELTVKSSLASERKTNCFLDWGITRLLF